MIPGVGSSNLLGHPFIVICGDKMEERKYPCLKCLIGELFDANAGGMFCTLIECDNLDCDYTDDSDVCGCITE